MQGSAGTVVARLQTPRDRADSAGGVLGNGHQGGSDWSRARSACGQEVVNQDQMTWALGGRTKNFILRDQERDRGGRECV